ncbi:MAG TPA: ATP synthase F1 subunit gamma [Candidatus Kapabacteria bacterium]|nr:ATP synthase F1 subunit gamma [Candidatus Kapabacteria bacterium]
MATLRDIKHRIQSVESIKKITQAMKMVATAKLRRVQNQVESSRPYFQKLREDITTLLTTVEGDFSHPFIEKREEIKNIAVIAIASDRGMCGSFNTNIFKHIISEIENTYSKQFPEAKIYIIPIGKKTVSYFQKHTYPILSSFINIADNLKFELVQDILSPLEKKYINGELDAIFVHYSKFVSQVKQEPSSIQLLPIALDSDNSKDTHKHNIDFIFEPNKKQILENLIPRLIDSNFWSALLETTAAEHAARRLAMDNATRNASDMIQNLTLTYNNVRQANITKEIIEIVSAANAQAL